MKKRAIATLFAVLLLGVTALASGCGGETEEKFKVTEKGTPLSYGALDMHGLGTDVMPISGFIGPTDLFNLNGYSYPSIVTDAVYRRLAEAGVNVIMETKYDLAQLGKGTELENALELAEKNGIYYLMTDTDLINVDGGFVAETERMAERLESLYQEYPSLAGIYVRDEPSVKLFETVKTAQENFAAANASAGTDYTSYANLFPQTSGTQLSGDPNQGVTYETYVNEFCKTSPPFLMYDFYPFEGLDGAISASWFSMLNIYREKSEELGVPYWLWLQAGGKWPDAPNKRLVTEAEMLWSIGTSLAMGAKGMGYFPLCMPPEYVTWGIESPYNAGLINQFGTANPSWYYAVKAAKQIQAVDGVLMNSKSMGLISHGESPCTMRGDYLLTSFRQLTGVEGDPCVIGCFDYLGGTALYVVNNSTQSTGDFSLKFSDSYGYDIVRRGETSFRTGKNLDFSLEAGESVLVTLR